METAVVASFEAIDREAPSRPFPRISFDEAMQSLRLGQAGPAVRPRDPGCDRGDARLRVRGVQERRRRFASSWRRRCSREARSSASRTSRRNGARRASPTSSWTRTGRCARRSRSSSRRPSWPHCRRRAGRRCSSARGPRQPCFACSACCACTSGRELDLIDADLDVFHWVLDFPLFERDEESGEWTFMHHAFTAPVAGTEVWDESNPADVRGQHYDLVWNGWELGSGSIRIHDAELQRTGVPDDRPDRGRGAVEVRLPARGARDGRPAARRLRHGDRALHRAPGGRAGHPSGDRLPEDLKRVGSAHGRAHADAGRSLAGARRAGRSPRKRRLEPDVRPSWLAVRPRGAVPRRARRRASRWRSSTRSRSRASCCSAG